MFILFMFIKFSSMLFIKISIHILLLDELDDYIVYGKWMERLNTTISRFCNWAPVEHPTVGGPRPGLP